MLSFYRPAVRIFGQDDLQQFAEELLRSPLVTPRLDEDVEHIAVLVDGPP